MDIDKVQSLIGKPYHPEKFNCWHLVMELVPKAPTVNVVATKMIGIDYFTNEKYYDGFHEVCEPQDGDIVLLGDTPNTLHHAGVFINGGVIHAEQPSVVFRMLKFIKRQYKEVRFYRENN